MPRKNQLAGKKIPRATYRFQFNENFRLSDARLLVPYLHELGISHVYASPLFAASPHSLHGYDVCDFSRLNPELGTEEDLAGLVANLHARKMGLILDIVPNHMGISSPENAWWWDVLTHGKQSKYAGHFDIDWQSPEKNLRGKILAPVLGEDYATLLQKGEIQLRRESKKIVLAYHEHRFPLTPESIAKLPAGEAALKKINSDFVRLDKLIRAQNYVLEFHARGDAKLNYRRFFAVSTLAAVRVENEKVFNETHAIIGKWYEKGWVDGLRVDHPDGLRDPQKYLERLRALAPNAWIVVEKILEPREELPENWPVAGTTGYDFLNQLNGVFVDSGAGKKLTDFYAEFTGDTTDYPSLAHEKKRAVLKTLQVSELNRLAGLLQKNASEDSVGKFFHVNELREALMETIVFFPVYRTYISETTCASANDINNIKIALHLACEARRDLPVEIFSYLHGLLLSPPLKKNALDFITRFQQLTGPVMAKGVEDTAFYCYNRFASLNEVGGAPEKFGVSPEKFHEFLQQQQTRWPHSQLTTSTHDTKRAEDVRARLNVLSEIPEIWREKVLRWAQMNEAFHQNNFPDRNAEYLFYQTLVGAWPLSESRAQFYMEKAAHESKQHTTWTNRNEIYENVLKNFVSKMLKNLEFTSDVEKFVETISEAAAVNSLALTLIKLTAPGVPDIYQGCESWDLSLVDPDNRRPVDFVSQQKLLAKINLLTVEKIWARRAEGLPKLFLIQKTLKLRERFADFSAFGYEPLFARGPNAENVVAFSRGGNLITLIPRFFFKLKNDLGETFLRLPAGNWRNEFTGEIFEGEIRVETFFKKFPAALLVRKED
jgi:(1->4)-alpha-D-glucan 1-alpha-D-glucosylmutase